ncbi:ABC transporter A family member 2-like isoform X2 [Punica granatum]|uniref:ABC transporter A family member 2-like isoform X2 n=1 Tax=Punica granatum TaxID=22663 RepID=A0A6P8BUW0_PUNGR|nr:ABC transporter A family member 2-like isoform X2 [Punica granatum]
MLAVGNFTWEVTLKEFPHPPIKTFSAMVELRQTIFLMISMISFRFQISSLITEKEQKVVMTLRDLLDSAYWLSWLTSDRIIILISSLFTVLFRMMSQFDFFLNNSFTVVFLLLFLFQFNMIGFSFMLPAFLSESASSSMIGFYIFIAGYLQEQLMKFGFPYNTSSSNMHRTIWSLFPPNLLTKAVKLLADATSTLVILESVGRAARNVLQMIPK